MAENLKVVLRALNLRLDPIEAARGCCPFRAYLTWIFRPCCVRTASPGWWIPWLIPSGARPWPRDCPGLRVRPTSFPWRCPWTSFYASLWQGLGGLSRADRRIAGSILGTLADVTNITWTGRFRDIYSFPPEETYQYLLEAGSFISPAARHDLAFAPDTGEMILRLPRRSYIECSRAPGTGPKWRSGSVSTGGGPGEKPGAPPLPDRSAHHLPVLQGIGTG